MNITAKLTERQGWYGLTVYILTYTLDGESKTIEFTAKAAAAEYLGNLILGLPTE